MEIDLSAYHDTISVIKSDLMTIELQKQITAVVIREEFQCPAQTAVYNSQSLKCESSLFFSNREGQPFVSTEAHLSPPDTVSAT